MEYAIVVAGALIGLGIYAGLGEIATVLRLRTIDINVKLPPIHLRHDGDKSP